MRSVATRNHTGFTLIELMVTVIIIGIIAAIALPSYQEQVRKTRRVNAQSDLLELASYMERYYTENFTYAGASLPFDESPKSGDGTKYYDLSIAASNATSYRLAATPKNAQSDDRCKSLTVNHRGEQKTTSNANDCW